MCLQTRENAVKCYEKLHEVCFKSGLFSQGVSRTCLSEGCGISSSLHIYDLWLDLFQLLLSRVSTGLEQF